MITLAGGEWKRAGKRLVRLKWKEIFQHLHGILWYCKCLTKFQLCIGIDINLCLKSFQRTKLILKYFTMHAPAASALVYKELDRLVQLGILEPTQFTEWAAPIVTLHYITLD